MSNRYYTRLRPVMGGGIPAGVTWKYVEAPHDLPQLDLPRSKHRYGVFETDRPLTVAELHRFDISPLLVAFRVRYRGKRPGRMHEVAEYTATVQATDETDARRVFWSTRSHRHDILSITEA